MKCLDLSLPQPEQNLACDEALLDWCEQDPQSEVLRFWESPQYFVVLGLGNRYRQECHLSNCERDNVPILRRCSGGGTVLQGPGCWNYSLILRIADRPELATITGTNRFVMERHRQALASLLNLDPRVQGHTDLTLENLKFSGNAQRRRKHCLLFHGTLLLNFDLEKIGRYLQLPERQPEYRLQRDHGSFLANLRIPARLARNAWKAAWQAAEPLQAWPKSQTASLANLKYRSPDWNLKR